MHRGSERGIIDEDVDAEAVLAALDDSAAREMLEALSELLTTLGFLVIHCSLYVE